MNEYQEQLLDHYHNPRNFGAPKFHVTSSSKLQNLSCGDEIEVFISAKDGKLDEISFKGEGCSIAIGAASLLYSTLKGEDIEFVKNFKLDELLEIIGLPLTTTRIKCANLSLEALKDSIKA